MSNLGGMNNFQGFGASNFQGGGMTAFPRGADVSEAGTGGSSGFSGEF